MIGVCMTGICHVSLCLHRMVCWWWVLLHLKRFINAYCGEHRLVLPPNDVMYVILPVFSGLGDLDGDLLSLKEG